MDNPVKVMDDPINPDESQSLKDFRQQQANANKHTERGLSMLEKSMQEVGYTAPIITAADNEIISGSARHQVAADVFGSDANPIVIESDGTRPIVVRRTDVANAQTERAKRISLFENRVAEVDLQWDAAELDRLVKEMPEALEGVFSDDELSEILQAIPDGNVQIDESAMAETNCECPKCGFKWMNAQQ